MGSRCSEITNLPTGEATYSYISDLSKILEKAKSAKEQSFQIGEN